jgi:CYTH domain-containing protein
MGVEIERKFLVVGEPWALLTGSYMRQGYLARGGVTVRVRRLEDGAVLTIKGPTEGWRRAEYEYAIPTEDADELLELCENAPIHKTRYCIAHDGLTWEVDVFHGPNEGLVTAEIELESEEQTFALPPWVGPEISDDVRYRNAALAAQPFSTWSG